MIVGGNTVRQDNPHLTSHQVALHNPLRVVMSRTLELPKEAYLWQVEVAPTLVLTIPGSNPRFQDWLRDRQVEVVELMPLTPMKVMDYLYDRAMLAVLWECGGTLAASAIADGSIQKVLAFIAPKLIGGQTAPSPVGNLGFTQMTEALTLERVCLHTIGPDYLLEGYLSSKGN